MMPWHTLKRWFYVLMLLIAALVKLTSPGPIFYRQERCSLNGRSFQMLKFRSMGHDAETHSGPPPGRRRAA